MRSVQNRHFAKVRRRMRQVLAPSCRVCCSKWICWRVVGQTNRSLLLGKVPWMTSSVRRLHGIVLDSLVARSLEKSLVKTGIVCRLIVPSGWLGPGSSSSEDVCGERGQGKPQPVCMRPSRALCDCSPEDSFKLIKKHCCGDGPVKSLFRLFVQPPDQGDAFSDATFTYCTGALAVLQAHNARHEFTGMLSEVAHRR
ncbi:hypothetical protein BKA81DRAFT_221555 [Phyllosticta paracitricarpa]